MGDFNKQVGKFIDKVKEEKLKENWKKTKIRTQSSFMGADILSELLKTPGAVGLRIYYGLDDEGNLQPIFVASDENGKPIKSSVSKAGEDEGGAETSLPCPPYCPQ